MSSMPLPIDGVEYKWLIVIDKPVEPIAINKSHHKSIETTPQTSVEPFLGTCVLTEMALSSICLSYLKVVTLSSEILLAVPTEYERINHFDRGRHGFGNIFCAWNVV